MRCTECGMVSGACLCGSFQPALLKTRVHIVLHAAELKKASNTGKIARLLLSNSALHVHGHVNNQKPTELALSPGYEPVLLFPGGSEELAPQDHPLELIVPDASWSQAVLMGRRIPYVKTIRHVHLPAPSPSFVLRRATTGRLSTMESIIRALGILEGAEVERALMETWAHFARALLAERGKIPGTADYAKRDFTQLSPE